MLNGNPTGTDITYDSSSSAQVYTVSNYVSIAGYDSTSLGAVTGTDAYSMMLLVAPIQHPDGVYTVSVWTKFPLGVLVRGPLNIPLYRTLIKGLDGDVQVHGMKINDDSQS